MGVWSEAPRNWVLIVVLNDLISILRIRVLEDVCKIICPCSELMSVVYIFRFRGKFGATLMFISWFNYECLRSWIFELEVRDNNGSGAIFKFGKRNIVI